MTTFDNNENGTIYLSGSMQFAPDNSLGGTWRLLCANELRLLGFFPIDITMLDKEYTRLNGSLEHTFGSPVKHHLEMKSNLRKHFVDADLSIITNNTDAVVLFYDEGVRRGAGTTSEAQHAYNLNIPIYIVSNYENWNEEIPGWLMALSTKIFSTFDELYAYLGALPAGILKKDIYGNRGTENEYLCSLCGDDFHKNNNHFVSKITPLYCTSCVDLVIETHTHNDRYTYMVEMLKSLD